MSVACCRCPTAGRQADETRAAKSAAPVTLAAAIESEPKLQAFRDEDPVVARAFDIAQRLEGLTRHASTHAAGIVIGDRPLGDLVPLYRDPKSDMPVTQFNMKSVEPAGLVKFDFLGLKTLTVLDVAVKLLKQRGVDVDLATLPLDDAASTRCLPAATWSACSRLKVRACGARWSTCGPTVSRTSSRWWRCIVLARWRTFRPIAPASMATKSRNI